MSDDFDGGDFDNDNGEGDIPEDLEADIEERVQQEVDERVGDLYADSQPSRSSGCLLILALPALALWFLG
ncbi:MAG: hypothetical protein RJA95_1030 [Verrucomicrobiota bacterium]|jgi:hypothetical protein